MRETAVLWTTELAAALNDNLSLELKDEEWEPEWKTLVENRVSFLFPGNKNTFTEITQEELQQQKEEETKPKDLTFDGKVWRDEEHGFPKVCFPQLCWQNH